MIAGSQAVLTQPLDAASVCHVLFRFDEGAKARDLLARLVGRVSVSARPARPPSAEISVGLTHEGLRALGTPEEYLRVCAALSPAFAQGAALRAARQLGDTGASAAERWPPLFTHHMAHLIVSVRGIDRAAVDAELLQLERLTAWKQASSPHPPLTYRGAWLPPPGASRPLKRPQRLLRLGSGLRAAAQGVKDTLQRFLGYTDTHSASASRWVHFGYRDDISRVQVDWGRTPGALNAKREQHAPGEFLLGRVNDVGSNPWALSTSPQRLRDFFHDASFGVLRVIEQDTVAFDNAVSKWVEKVINERPQMQGRADLRDYVKAKLCGRWPDGRDFDPNDPDSPHPQQVGRPPEQLDHSQDPHGLRCPFGAHVRRVKASHTSGGGEVHTRSRPLIRRSMPYGAAHADPTANDGKARGLLGWFFCADIEHQFEHVLRHWVERPPLGQALAVSSKDPLIGQHEGRTTFEIPYQDTPQGSLKSIQLGGFAPFCTTRGTLYAMYLSHRALTTLAQARFFADSTDGQAA